MGHIHLGVLPRTRAWREVVNLLTTDASPRDVVRASAVAAERDLRKAADNPDFVEIVRILAMIPQAAKSEAFGRALRDLGIPVRDDPELIHVLAATGDWLCCANPVRDSSRESSVVAVRYEQTHPPCLQD